MALRVVKTLSGEDVTTHNYTVIFPIESVSYEFEFKYNPRIDRWVLNVTHPNGDPVIVGAVCVHNVNLFSYANPTLRPRGTLVCTWKSDAEGAGEPGEFDLGKTAQIVYFERPEDLITQVVEDPPLA